MVVYVFALNADFVRDEVSYLISEGPKPWQDEEDTATLQAVLDLPDEEIESWLNELADDAFYAAIDDLRSRTIEHLKSMVGPAEEPFAATDDL
jgi:hypothetical protein